MAAVLLRAQPGEVGKGRLRRPFPANIPPARLNTLENLSQSPKHTLRIDSQACGLSNPKPYPATPYPKPRTRKSIQLGPSAPSCGRSKGESTQPLSQWASRPSRTTLTLIERTYETRDNRILRNDFCNFIASSEQPTRIERQRWNRYIESHPATRCRWNDTIYIKLRLND